MVHLPEEQFLTFLRVLLIGDVDHDADEAGRFARMVALRVLAYSALQDAKAAE